MSRKDFVLIARIISGLRVPDDVREHVARQFGYQLGDSNARFDYQRFVNACKPVSDDTKGGR